jgi:hypothetical protein
MSCIMFKTEAHVEWRDNPAKTGLGHLREGR